MRTPAGGAQPLPGLRPRAARTVGGGPAGGAPQLIYEPPGEAVWGAPSSARSTRRATAPGSSRPLLQPRRSSRREEQGPPASRGFGLGIR